MTRPFQSRAYTLADREAFDRRYSWPPVQPLAAPMPRWIAILYRAAFCIAGLAALTAVLS